MSKSIFYINKIIYLFALCIIHSTVKAQAPVKHISVQEAISLSMDINKHIRNARLQTGIAKTKAGQLADEKVPEVGFHGNYMRLGNLVQYDRGLKDPVTYKTIHDKVDFTMEAKLPIYKGGKIQQMIKKGTQEVDLSVLKTAQTERQVRLQIHELYLDIYKLMEMQRLVEEHIKEEQTRLEQVKSLKNNGLVTKNEILRAQLQLSEQQMNLLSVKNDIEISLHQLQLWLELDENTAVTIDTPGLVKAAFSRASVNKNLQLSYGQQDDIKILKQEKSILETERKIIKGNILPTVDLVGSYGLNYPNYYFFPPDPNWYHLGMAGVDINFSITKLFTNKKKVKMAAQELSLQDLRIEIAKEQVSQQVHTAVTKYNEYIDKIDITEHAIRQATENYRIVKQKYLNQLALITDMIDADNELLAAQFNASSTRIETQKKWYELQYITGSL